MNAKVLNSHDMRKAIGYIISYASQKNDFLFKNIF